MADRYTFLDVAELVLLHHNAPLTADDIVRIALELREFNSEGATPETAMRARLSEDVRINGTDSRFQRVKPNRFALRRWQLKEYVAVPFEKREVRESVVCVRQEALERAGRFFGYTKQTEPYIRLVESLSDLVFVERATAETSDDLKQLICYVLLEKHDGTVLTYRRGAYSTAARFLRGAYCVGFGGHVQEADAFSLFGRKDGGLMQAVSREVSEELKGLIPKDVRLLGVINDDSSPTGLRHLAFVFHGRLPDDFQPEAQRRELSVTDLSLLSRHALWDRFDRLEFWSQLVARHVYPKRSQTNTRVSIRTSKRRGHPIVLVGEIASGKTEAAKNLLERHGIPVISTRDCVAELIGMADFGTGDRALFQAKAAEFISGNGGLRRLAFSIADKMTKLQHSPVIIDGIRNIETVDRLRELFPGMVLLYVEAPRDKAYANYCTRGNRLPSGAVLAEFRSARSHVVEREVPLLRYRADAEIFNDGTLSDLFDAIDVWARSAL